MTDVSYRSWIGYDWFKLIVALILAALLLVFRPTAGIETGAVAPAASPAPVATAAPSAQITLPVLRSPAAGAPVAPGTIAFSGTTAPGAEVQVLVDDIPAGKARAGADGVWTLNATVEKPGEHQVIVQALDDKGAVAAAANPATLSIAAPAMQIAAPTIDLPVQSLTEGETTIGGTGTAGSTIEIMLDGAPVGSTTVGPDGTWSLPLTLPAGDHEIVAQARDAAGQVAAAANPWRVAIASAVPAPTAAVASATQAPAITAPADGTQLDSGTITIAGTGVPGSQIEILDSDKVIGTATVQADGTWSFEATPNGATAAYSARPVGSADVATKPIRVTFGSGSAGACDALAIGCDAWVTRSGGLVLRMRAGAGTSQSIIARLPVGTQLKLLEGPQALEQLSWWRVRTIGGREGWVAGEELRNQPD
jgi:hypothetical protein